MGREAVKNFHRQTDKLLQLYPKPDAPVHWNQEVSNSNKFVCAYCVIELNDLWSHFCRSLSFSLASGKAIDAAGSRLVAANPLTTQQAVAAVVNSRGYEPKWHNAVEACLALDKLNTPNKANAKIALSAVSSPAKDINIARNYFAHRKSDCRQKLMAAQFYHRDMVLDPFRIGNFLRSDGRSNIQFWIDELRLVSWACIT